MPIERLPLQLGDWEGRDTAGLSIRSQDILKLSRFVKREYVKGDRSVILYIGYWKKQTGDYQAAKHSPALCLPSNGWSIERRGGTDLALTNSSADAFTTQRILGEIRGASHLFYYWFFTGQKNYSEEWQALLNISFQKLFSGRSVGGIVEVSVPLLGGKAQAAAEGEAADVLEDFLKSLYPELSGLIEASKA